MVFKKEYYIELGTTGNGILWIPRKEYSLCAAAARVEANGLKIGRSKSTVRSRTGTGET